MYRVLCWKTCLGLGWHSLCSFGGQSLLEQQLKLGLLHTVCTAGGPMSSNLPSSFPSNCPAALSQAGWQPTGKAPGAIHLPGLQRSMFLLCLTGSGEWVASGPVQPGPYQGPWLLLLELGLLRSNSQSLV